MATFILVLVVSAVCGGIGATARQALLDRLAKRSLGVIKDVNAGMLCVNLLGCVLSAVVVIVGRMVSLNVVLSTCISAGLLGGFYFFFNASSSKRCFV